jgi:hypothetical protein
VLQPLAVDNQDGAFDDAHVDGAPDWLGGGGGDDGADDKENAQGLPGSAGKGAGRMAWPADAEKLAEQEGGAEGEAADGGFTNRTRLVVRHLQRAAAAAGGGGGGGGGSAAGTPRGGAAAAGSKRRFSAAALAPPLGAEGADKAAGGGSGAAAGGPVLSFNRLTEGHGRLDACRWFYEVLVLTNRGLVGVQQEASYGDIRVTPHLAAMARV